MRAIRPDGAGLALWACLAGGARHAVARRAGRAHRTGRSNGAGDDLGDKDWGSTKVLPVIAVVGGVAAAAHKDRGLRINAKIESDWIRWECASISPPNLDFGSGFS